MRNAKLIKQIQMLYQYLLEQHGWQKWWSNTSKFEIIVGAILVQNTNWKNVDKSLQSLHSANLLTPEGIKKASIPELIKHIKYSGLYNQKAQYLKNISEWFINAGGFNQLKKLKTVILRQQLLSLNGIGKETADVILLYVFKRPVFIIDNYTQRLLMELEFINKKWNYDDLQDVFHQAFAPDVKIYSEYHALIIHHGKTYKA